MATVAGSTLRRGAASLPHRLVYTLLFAFVALAAMTFAVPVMRQYSGEHEQIIGEATVRNENGGLFAEVACSQIAMVAGAGYGPYLTEPFRVPLCRA